MARYDDLNTKTISYLTFLSAVLLVVTILLLQALCYNWIEWQEDLKYTKQSYNSSDEVIRAQKESLTSYEKVQVTVPVKPAVAAGATDGAGQPSQAGDPAQPAEPQMETVERVHIPIERAKVLILEDVNSAAGKPATTPNT